jgi:hypothetical protein
MFLIPPALYFSQKLIMIIAFMQIGPWFQMPVAQTALQIIGDRKSAVAAQGAINSFHTERFEAAAGRKIHRMEM